MAKKVLNMLPSDILDYWFTPPMTEHWFNSTPEIDADMHERFSQLWLAAACSDCDSWGEEADGALALVILLDQIPLNIFRGKSKSFTTEHKSRVVSRRAIDKGLDQAIKIDRRSFLYMPFMHSEDLSDQDECVRLMGTDPAMAEALKFAEHHRDIIKRFGRFPHRNAIFGRKSTADEIEWLDSAGGFKG